ncbi:alanine racemase domain protein [Dehalogenimonas lykanthroporepellens BL-DC-9]|jgi:pyridoxal phosphate enzyme (YggS family)|nr:alanine racemase domain protein [Dehalogenimonas lykanthroporepellens BL-DC-9]
MYRHITKNIECIKKEIPSTVTIEAVVKKRSIPEITTALQSGVDIVAFNYVQEAREIIGCLNKSFIPFKSHYIGHLQKNKVAKSTELFDFIETIDDTTLAQSLNNTCRKSGVIMPVLIQVNIGRESSKSGAWPDNVIQLAETISCLPNLCLRGIMTMGPEVPSIRLRPFFVETKTLLDELVSRCLVSGPEILSMGMSDSYMLAIEEGANFIRLGKAIFSPGF